MYYMKKMSKLIWLQQVIKNCSDCDRDGICVYHAEELAERNLQRGFDAHTSEH